MTITERNQVVELLKPEGYTEMSWSGEVFLPVTDESGKPLNEQASYMWREGQRDSIFCFITQKETQCLH